MAIMARNILVRSDVFIFKIAEDYFTPDVPKVVFEFAFRLCG
jgi:hypothetical protein